MTPYRCFSEAQRIRDFLMMHPHEIAQFHDLSLQGILRCKFVERFVHCEHRVVRVFNGNVHFLNVQALPFSAVAHPLPATCAINKNTAHGFGGSTKEMRAILPTGLGFTAQSEPRFVHEGGRLERLTRDFAGHFCGCQVAQFIVNQRKQIFRCVGFACFNGAENSRDIAHRQGLLSLVVFYPGP